METLDEGVKLVREGHPVDQRAGTVVNLSLTRVLNKEEKAVLHKGLSFVPNCQGMGRRNWNRLEAEAGLTEYHRRLKLAAFFEEEEEVQRAPFTLNSGWEPQDKQVPQIVQQVIKEDQKIIKGIKEVMEAWNLSQEEWRVLKGLRQDNSIVIKPADKGCIVVVMDRWQYVREAMRQLEDTEFYKELGEPIYMESVEQIKKELQVLQGKGILNKKQTKYIGGLDTPRERIFYLLPKVHKDRASWPFPDMPPGRPIVSDCGSESYGVAEWITYYLNPLSTRHTSYIRDTYQFLERIHGMEVKPNARFFSMDVESLYTNIETKKGLEAVRKCLQRYPEEGRPDDSIIKLLELILTNN